MRCSLCQFGPEKQLMVCTGILVLLVVVSFHGWYGAHKRSCWFFFHFFFIYLISPDSRFSFLCLCVHWKEGGCKTTMLIYCDLTRTKKHPKKQNTKPEMSSHNFKIIYPSVTTALPSWMKLSQNQGERKFSLCASKMFKAVLYLQYTKRNYASEEWVAHLTSYLTKQIKWNGFLKFCWQTSLPLVPKARLHLYHLGHKAFWNMVWGAQLLNFPNGSCTKIRSLLNVKALIYLKVK